MPSSELEAAVERLRLERENAGMRDSALSVAAACDTELEARSDFPDGLTMHDVDAGGVGAKWTVPQPFDSTRRIVYCHGGAIRHECSPYST